MDENQIDDAEVIFSDGDTDNQQDSEETAVDLAEELEREREARRQVTGRAKRAEDELKKYKSNPVQSQINNPSVIDSGELRLIARNHTDEEIEKAKRIAKVDGISIEEASKTEDFTDFVERRKDKERKEKAKLGASRGSGGDSDNSLIKTEMTDAEHKEAWKKLQS